MMNQDSYGEILEVDWQADGEKLQLAAAGHEEVTFLFPENANHGLRKMWYQPRWRRATMAPIPAWTHRPWPAFESGWRLTLEQILRIEEAQAQMNIPMGMRKSASRFLARCFCLFVSTYTY
jgi:hypothetical protein